jgi:Spy/CpxP family protein refolding chaperone
MKNSLLKALISSVAAGFTMLFVAVGSWSMPHGGSYDFDSEQMTSFLSKKLDLTEEQEVGVTELMTASLAESEADMQRLQILHAQLRNPAGEFDEASARAAADEIGGITARLVFLRVSTFAQISELLTEEQRAEAIQMMEKRSERRGSRRGHMRGHFE